MNATASIPTRLRNVESGYAEVLNADTGRRIGKVSRIDPWMTTHTRWEARNNGRIVGHGDTRAEAIAELVKHFVAKQVPAPTEPVTVVTPDDASTDVPLPAKPATNMHGRTAVQALPTIVRYIGITDGGEPNSERCPHCDAKGRIIHNFEVEYPDGRRERRGAMSGCVQLFPMSSIAKHHKRLMEKGVDYAKKGWTLNKSETEMLAIIDAYHAGDIEFEQAERELNAKANALAAWRHNKYRGRR